MADIRDTNAMRRAFRAHWDQLDTDKQDDLLRQIVPGLFADNDELFCLKSIRDTLASALSEDRPKDWMDSLWDARDLLDLMIQRKIQHKENS